MPTMIDCAACGETFDLYSPEKRRAGGLRNHCPDCAEETTVPYLAVKSANGKMSDLTILAFDSQRIATATSVPGRTTLVTTRASLVTCLVLTPLCLA